VIGLAIAGNPENDGHLSPWQEVVGHGIIPDTHKNGWANECHFARRTSCSRPSMAGTEGFDTAGLPLLPPCYANFVPC
jgi:hypothetical protein